MKRPGTLRRRRKAPRTQLEQTASERWIAEVKRQPVLISATQPSGGFMQTVGHHIIPRQTLESWLDEILEPVTPDRRAAIIWDVRNGLHVSKRRHERHHSGHEPIPRLALPDAVFEFADEFGFDWYLDRHYPKEETP